MNRITKDSEIRNRLSKEAYIENSSNRPVIDGPIEPNKFFTTNKARTAFITQEPYGVGDNGGWDMSKSLNAKSSLKEQNRNGLPTFKNEVKCASILNGRKDDPMSTTAYDIYKETTAVINVKKEPNCQSRSNPTELKQHTTKNSELLKEQYSNLGLTSKDTTILAGTKDCLINDVNDNTVEIFGRKFNKQTDVTSIKKGKHTYIKYDNGDGKEPIIAAPHPSASRFGQGDYADNINEIRNKKTQREIHQNQKGQSRQQENIRNNTHKQQKSQTSFGSSIVDIGANVCKSSLDYIKNNPKTVAFVVAGTVVVLTSGFYLYRKYKKKKH